MVHIIIIYIILQMDYLDSIKRVPLFSTTWRRFNGSSLDQRLEHFFLQELYLSRKNLAEFLLWGKHAYSLSFIVEIQKQKQLKFH